MTNFLLILNLIMIVWVGVYVTLKFHDAAIAYELLAEKVKAIKAETERIRLMLVEKQYGR